MRREHYGQVPFLRGQWLSAALVLLGIVVPWAPGLGQELTSFRFGNSEAVWDVGISPDGKSLVAVSRLGNAKVWGVESQEERLSIQAHDREIPAVAFSPDSKSFLTASYDKKIRKWDLQSGKRLLTIKVDSSPYDVAVSPSGTTLASSHQDGIVRLWQPTTGNAIRSLRGHNGYVGCIAFSSSGEQLASSSFDQTLRLWNVGAGTQLRMIQGGRGNFWGEVQFVSGDQSLLAGNVSGVIGVWDLRTGTAKHTWQAHSANILGLAISPDGRLAASAAADNLVKVWDLRLRSELKTLRGHDRKVHAVAFSPDGKLLASGCYGGKVILWDISASEHQPKQQR